MVCNIVCAKTLADVYNGFAQRPYMRLTFICTHPRWSESEGSLPAGRWLPVIQAKIVLLTVLLANVRKVCRVADLEIGTPHN